MAIHSRRGITSGDNNTERGGSHHNFMAHGSLMNVLEFSRPLQHQERPSPFSKANEIGS
eukprot:c17505_g1_i1 orf=209-385(-)